MQYLSLWIEEFSSVFVLFYTPLHYEKSHIIKRLAHVIAI